VSGAKRALTAAERALWRRVVAAVEPSRGRPAQLDEEVESAPLAVSLAPKKASPPAQIETRTSAAARRAAPAPISDRAGERRVRRGQVEIEAVLDLHGRTLESAHAILSSFLRDARRRGLRCVLVITGKGARGEGAIRRAVPLWLEANDLKQVVSGLAQAHRSHGGEGALYVFLKRAA
jgi:DNA-nicking Smr family endonuclease